MKRVKEKMDDWFTIDEVDKGTYIISEYRHWEETHCYLLNGSQYSLLIDTGLGICDISKVVNKLAARPVIASATHIHWDHIGGHRYYPNFYAHAAELGWLSGGFPQPIEIIRRYVAEGCELPENFDVNSYSFFQGIPAQVLYGGEEIDLGERRVKVLHTPGHSPGHMCFWEKDKGRLYTGDLVYKGMLAAWFPSTDPEAYLRSLEMITALPARQIFPAHHSLNIHPEIMIRMRDAFRMLRETGKLCHGSGTFHYRDWSVQL